MGNSPSSSSTPTTTTNSNTRIPDDIPAEKNISEWSERDFVYRSQYLTEPCALFANHLLQHPEKSDLSIYLNLCYFSYLDKTFDQCMKQQHQLDLPTDMFQEFKHLVKTADADCWTRELNYQFAERAARLHDPSVQERVESSWNSTVLQAKRDEMIDASRDTKEEVQAKFQGVIRGTCAPYSVLDSNGQYVKPNIDNWVNTVYRFEMFDSCVNMTMCASVIRECMNRNPNMTAVDCLFSNKDPAVSQCRKRLADDVNIKGIRINRLIKPFD